ncbi:MAG TPA: type III polyketide synthase [Trueperaceae bacterium]
MPVFIQHLETVCPPTAYRQDHILEVMKAQLAGDRRTGKLLERIYRHSGIERRHSVIPDFAEGAAEGNFYDPATRRLKTPSTGLRNDLYAVAAKELYCCLARRVLAACPGVEAADITHVITVSCTGFFAPGPGYVIVRELGLGPDTQRYHLGFMGCYAAFPALKMAQAFCEADPGATVLVVCLELCTLHFQASTELDSLVSASVFADGGAAAIVSSRAPAPGVPALALEGFSTALTPDGEQDMAWTIGDTGFDMVLSSYVPAILEANVRSALAPLLERLGLSLARVDRWAVHPGGRAILDKVERGLELEPDALAASREVLRRYGNMSSATVLFVLQEVLCRGASAGESVYAMTFGPGLTVESGLFRVHAD